TVRLHACLAEEARVGHARLQHRHGDRTGIELAEDVREWLVEAEVRLRRSWIVAHDVELDVLASDEVVQLADQVVGCLAREDAAVELELDLARDDVDLVASVDDRRAHRVADHAAEDATARADRA